MITGESQYLKPLIELAQSPEVIHIIGTLPSERQLSVAIIGTRKPTPYGKEVTYQLAYGLAQRGVVIVSGIAFGIDSIAHRAALDAKGLTIAILAGGLDKIYPSSHQKLAQEIIESGGALISEYPDGTPTRKFQFLARNRLVSGLADALIVTEASSRSGTVSTINHALDQNKDVFSVPGNITSPLSAGPNVIISQGATPIISVNDFINTLCGSSQLALPMPEIDSPEATILQLIRSGVNSGGELQTSLGLDASTYAQIITMLELQGIVHTTGGDRWSTD